MEKDVKEKDKKKEKSKHHHRKSHSESKNEKKEKENPTAIGTDDKQAKELKKMKAQAIDDLETLLEDNIKIPYINFKDAIGFLSLLKIPESVSSVLNTDEIEQMYLKYERTLREGVEGRFVQMLERNKLKIPIHQNWAEAGKVLVLEKEYSAVASDVIRAQLYQIWSNNLIELSLNELDQYVRNDPEFKSVLQKDFITIDDLRRVLRNNGAYKRLKNMKDERDRRIFRYIRQNAKPALRQEIDTLLAM
ncbi:MAG: hypothetical protein EZS28_044179 [Streblomastix strix]|uniref:Uncharacterized protein n=1 Tax=Streblomastix strix TaxID=222440 RepID=A0A5J4TP93_9EUKA|nr:MAG: hypothetical protein EZS28_044179 [Streblomastix strix]